MAERTQIQLNANRISNVPFLAYENDFTFIVNGENFNVPKIISDLISPVICHMHSNDASIDSYTINTVNRGNFQNILNLMNFQQNSIPENEIPFFVEVIEILGISSLDIIDLNRQTELNNNNIFDIIRRHEKFQVLYSDSFERDINYVSSNFFNLCETHLNDMIQLLPETLERIISNERLKLKNEEQLVKFINRVYRNDNNLDYSNLYKYVMFANVDEEAMAEFVDTYDCNDFNRDLWVALSKRLKYPIIKVSQDENERYREPKGKVFHPQFEDNYVGIINYLRSQSSGNISNKIDISASSIINTSYQPINVVTYENQNVYFYSNNYGNGYICFDFRNNKVIPANYQIMSFGGGKNSYNPKSWVIEGSNDNNNWAILDEKQNCAILNEAWKSHIFDITNRNSDGFRYIRMRLTDVNWGNNNYFCIASFELYGKLI